MEALLTIKMHLSCSASRRTCVGTLVDMEIRSWIGAPAIRYSLAHDYFAESPYTDSCFTLFINVFFVGRKHYELTALTSRASVRASVEAKAFAHLPTF